MTTYTSFLLDMNFDSSNSFSYAINDDFEPIHDDFESLSSPKSLIDNELLHHSREDGDNDCEEYIPSQDDVYSDSDSDDSERPTKQPRFAKNVMERRPRPLNTKPRSISIVGNVKDKVEPDRPTKSVGKDEQGTTGPFQISSLHSNDESEDFISNSDSDGSVRLRPIFTKARQNIVPESSDEGHIDDSDGTSSTENILGLSGCEPLVNDEEEADDVEIVSNLTRKRLSQPKQWARNKRKKQREQGVVYEDQGKKPHPARKPQSTCLKGCTFKCMMKFDDDDRQTVFEQFWKLSDEKKLHYYAKFITKEHCKRKRALHPAIKKQYSFIYFLECTGVRERVCREFFLTTLNISRQRVYYFFKHNFNARTGVAQSPTKGKHVKKQTDPSVVKSVIAHIKSFPTMDSHYCRENTQKQYLDQALSITLMHNMYLESVFIVQDKPTVQQHIYRLIFNTKFNLSFFKPKKDRCDICEAIKHIVTPSEDEQVRYSEHISKKLSAKEERDKDRAMFSKGKPANKETAVLSFDMQNVFSLPKAEVSNFFYKRKFNCFNLTAHCSLDGITYCAFWHEAMSGRAGNHIASALLKLLYAVNKANPHLKEVILWSDSCVPQNRNSIMSTAIKHFLCDEKTTVEKIEQKFSESGHGLIQEVDSVHSKIERGLKNFEVYSPVTLLRKLASLPPGRAPLKIIQLKSKDFFNFQGISSGYSFNVIPYTKVKHLSYDASKPMHIGYRLNFTEDEAHTNVRINRCSTPRATKKNTPPTKTDSLFTQAKILSVPIKLSVEKVKDIRSMYKFMPPVDVAFYKAVLGD